MFIAIHHSDFMNELKEFCKLFKETRSELSVFIPIYPVVQYLNLHQL